MKYFVEDSRCVRCGVRESVEHVCWTGCIAGHVWGGIMTGHKAMVSFNKIKEKEIIPILAWCCWRVRNLTVFEGFDGTDEEAKALVVRYAMEVIQSQESRIKEEAGRLMKLVYQGRVLESPLGKCLM